MIPYRPNIMSFFEKVSEHCYELKRTVKIQG